MSRVTPPVTKFTHALRRSISTTSTVASPSAQLKTKGAKADLISKLSAHERTITTIHRPLPPSIKTIPLMQGFRTSAPRPAASPSTLDHLILPRLPSESSTTFSMRVPILPDNFSATQSIKESIDTAIPKQEIHVVSALPEEDFAAVNVLTEVVGNEANASMDLGEWVQGIRSRGEEIKGKFVGSDGEQGVLSELWMSVREDVFGSKGKVAL